MQKAIYFPTRRIGLLVWIALLLLLFPGQATIADSVPFGSQQVISVNAGWQEVGIGSATGGGISNNSGGSEWPSVAIAPDNTPYLAWEDDSDGDNEIYVRRWNGSSWEEVGTGSATGGGISNNSGDSRWPSMAIAPDGTPYVSWRDLIGVDDEIYVRRWNGSGWEEVGTGSATGGGISNNSGGSERVSVAIAPDNTPYLAWEDDSDGEDEIYVRRWNGSSWEEVGTGSATGGGISNNSGDSRRPSMAIAPDGTPYVSWQDESDGDSEIYVRRWNGSSWEEVGTGSATGGGISKNNGDSFITSMAIAPDGTPYVSWRDLPNVDSEIYIRRWNGSSWEEVGTGSATGGGISNNSGDSRWPSLAIAPDGTPYISWRDTTSGNDEIYVRRWNGSSWEEVGTGSASGSGISNNSGTSFWSSMAIASDGTPYVSWDDDSNGNIEIYVRRGESSVSSLAVYLPIIVKPQPTILSVRNTTNQGDITVIVRNLVTKVEITRCTVPNGQTLPCDHNGDNSHIFPPGTYEVQAFTNCPGANPNPIASITYGSGPRTTTVACI